MRRTSGRDQIRVITEAQASLPEQLRSREVRYVAMMGLRIACLVLAVVLFGLRVPFPVIWLPLCLGGMVLLPWVAVLIANDRPPREESRFRHHLQLTRDPLPLTSAVPEPGVAAVDRPGTVARGGPVLDGRVIENPAAGPGDSGDRDED